MCSVIGSTDWQSQFVISISIINFVWMHRAVSVCRVPRRTPASYALSRFNQKPGISSWRADCATASSVCSILAFTFQLLVARTAAPLPSFNLSSQTRVQPRSTRSVRNLYLVDRCG
ncbi:hypothetical protein WR25_06032 [Diploscapter pachys]|uniref:Uncharacterized protein n=1 Tax=Diploscapter pachys TaxID=2018661 RepID=A0A2A2LQG3_9BILA|nr:hypothetical protein WR25_06032 [Diploscapter pachys]